MFGVFYVLALSLSFSFNCRFDITTDLNNYKDFFHYGEWINSLILRDLCDGKYQLTPDNYLNYLNEERHFYRHYDYTQLTNQEDYENDYYAAALFNKEITGTEPYRILDDIDTRELSSATVEINQYNGRDGLVCTGCLARPPEGETTVSNYLRDYEYVGAKIILEDLSPYKYLVFCGRKETNNGQLTVRLYDESGTVIATLDKNYQSLDNEWHQYVVDISNANNSCTLILNGGYIDNTGSKDSRYIFSDITLY